MPSVFSKRYLYDQDILDPREMNQDFQPFSELAAGNIDCDNIKATSFREVPLAKGTSCLPYYSEIVCHPRFAVVPGDTDTGAQNPNFLNFTDSEVQNLTPVTSGEGYALKSSSQGFIRENLQIIPIGSSWTPLAGGIDKIPRGNVQGQELTAGRSVEFTITTSQTAGESKLWINAFVQYVRNGFGYSCNEDRTHMDTSNIDATRYDDFPAKRPFDIFYVPGAKEEAYHPERCGLHHLSQGFSPADVQFAIRLNGQILEETITGKRIEHERSSLGMRHQRTRELQSNADTSTATFGSNPGVYKLPGPAQKRIKATALGPELYGTRLGTVVSVGSGPHTIEVVARRLFSTTKNTNMPFDVVGIHNRQLFVCELPVSRSVNVSFTEASSSLIESFEPEDRLSNPTMRLKQAKIEDLYSNLDAFAIRQMSLRKEHLGSKVLSIDTRVRDYDAFTYRDEGDDGVTSTRSCFLSIDNPTYWNNLTNLNSTGVTTTGTTSDAKGWSYLGGSGDSHSRVTNSYKSSGDLYQEGDRIPITDDSVLVVFADIQHQGIKAHGDAPLRHHHLNMFGAYAIGHREFAGTATSGRPGSTGSGASVNWRIDLASRVYLNSWNPIGRSDHYQLKDKSGTSNRTATDKRVDNGRHTFQETHVSLMFVIADPVRRRDPDGNFWKIGDIGLFFCAQQGVFDPGRPTEYKDRYWDRGGVVIDHAMRSYGSTNTFTLEAPEISAARATLSFFHLKR